MTQKSVERMLSFVESCDDPEKLRNICQRAREHGEQGLERAASLRLYEVSPKEVKGTFEHDVWKSIFALEHSLTTERGKTTRLQRTRNSITDHGERVTVARLLLKPATSEGFGMLVERDMLELTFEAVALRHPDRFSEAELEAARNRLDEVE